jgi:recombination protein RecA
MPPKKKAQEVETTEAAASVEEAKAAPPVRLSKGKDAKSQLGALLATDILEGTLKKYGKNSLILGAEVKARKRDRIPTGIFPLDLALQGGWAVGGIHTLLGHKSSGKTTTLFRSLGQAQKMCAECWTAQEACKCGNTRDPVIAYLDVEGAIDPAWASRFMELDKILVSTPEYAEQTIAIAEALLRSKKCDIIVIDSLAFMTTMKEIEEAVEKDLVGEQARRLGKGMRKFSAALNEAMQSEGKRPTLFFTNQIRMKVGVMFGNPETTSGGLAPGFAAWTELRTKPAKYKMDDNGEFALYGDFGFSVEKTRNSAPRMSYDYRVMLVETETKKLGEVYDEDFILAHAERHGLVTGGGSSWKCLEESFKKKTEIEERLLKDKAFRKQVTDALLAAVQPTL